MALRLACLFCFLAFVGGVAAGPAGAYTCGEPGSNRALSSHVTKADEKECAPPKPAERTADPISFAFFVGLIIAVLLVPIALGKREDRTPD